METVGSLIVPLRASSCPFVDSLPFNMPFSTIESAIEAIRDGRIVIVVDDEDRENEGDFIMAAEKCAPEAMNFIIKHGRGIPCVPTTAKRLAELELPMMVGMNTARLGTAMTVTV